MNAPAYLDTAITLLAAVVFLAGCLRWARPSRRCGE